MDKILQTIGSDIILLMIYLGFVLSLVGCSSKNDTVIDTWFYDQRPAISGIVITKAPVQVVYFGRVNENGRAFTRETLKALEKVPYRNYKFNKDTHITGGISGDIKDVSSDSNEISVKSRRR